MTCDHIMLNLMHAHGQPAASAAVVPGEYGAAGAGSQRWRL